MSASYEFAQQGPVQPFWQRMHRFFLLPLDKAVLLRMAGLSAAAMLSCLLVFLGAFGAALLMLAVVIILVAGSRYGFKIIERSSKGFLTPSDYPLTDEDLVSKHLPYKFVALLVVFVVLAGLLIGLLRAGEFARILIWGFFSVVWLPAASMRLVITGSLTGALNPAATVEVIKRIGKPYAALCVFVFFADLSRTYGMGALAVAGGLGGGAAGASVGGLAAALGFGTMLLIFMLSLGFWFFTYVICALIGYAMYQYSGELDISVVGPGEKRLMSSTGRHADVKARTRDALLGQMVSMGEVREAIALLSDDLRDRPHDLSLHARLHKLLIAEGSTPRIEDHTEKFLALMVKSENWREAIELAEEALGRRAEWTPRHADEIAPLARAALRAGKPQLAATLIKSFDKRYPNHPAVPQIYVIGAQLMAESAHKPDDARRILNFLLKKYAADPAAAEASRYLEVLNRMHPAG